MSFAKRLSIALEEESNLPIDASELDSGEASENLITDIANEDDSLSVLETDAEIQKDDESVNEAMEVVDEMSVNVDINEEALSDPSSVTEEQVEAAQECLKYNMAVLGMAEHYKDFSNKVKVGHESYSSPAERLQIAQEGLKETIAKIIEWIKNIFRKIAVWFKKMYAKLIVIFNRNQSRAKKVKELLRKKTNSNFTVDADEVASMAVDCPLVCAVLLSNPANFGIEKDSSLIEDVHTFAKMYNEAVATFGDLNENKLKNMFAKLKGQFENFQKGTLKDKAANLYKVIKDVVSAQKAGQRATEDSAAYKVITGGEKGICVFSRIDGKAPTALVIEIPDTVTSFSDFTFEYKKIEIDSESVENKIKALAKAKPVNYASMDTALNVIIKDAGKIKKFADNAFKTIETGGALANSFASAYKKMEKSQSGEMRSVDYTRAANIGRVASSVFVTDVVIGAIKAQGQAISLIARLITQFDDKKKK